MEQERMELDLDLLPTSTTTDSNILRRSSSEPLISGLGDNSQVFQADTLRTRRNSTSFMSQQSLLMPPSPFQNSIGQLNEVKQEESMDFLDREATCEQTSQSTINSARPSVPGSCKRKGEMAPEDNPPKRFFQGSTNMFSSDPTQLPDTTVCVSSDTPDGYDSSAESSD